MDVLSDELRELGSTARSLLERSASSSSLPPAFDAPAVLDRELWSSLAELGLLGLAVPEELGGSGGGATELCVLAEEVGAALPTVPFAGTVAVAAVLVAALDDDVARQVLRDVVTGTTVVAPAWETFPVQIVPGGGRSSLRLTDGRVQGTLRAVPFGLDADRVLAFAGPEDERRVVLLDAGHDAVRRRATTALDVVEPVATIDVASVAAPIVPISAVPTARIGIALAAELVGTARRALDGAVAYAKERSQFGRPIGSFQAIKHLLADRHVQLDAARMLVHTAAAALDAGNGLAREEAATAVIAACDAADATTGDALQVHGGIGFTWEHPSHVFLKRARARRVLLGSQGRQLDGLAGLILAS